MSYLVYLLIVLSPLWVPLAGATLVATAMVLWTQSEETIPQPHH